MTETAKKRLQVLLRKIDPDLFVDELITGVKDDIKDNLDGYIQDKISSLGADYMSNATNYISEVVSREVSSIRTEIKEQNIDIIHIMKEELRSSLLNLAIDKKLASLDEKIVESIKIHGKSSDSFSKDIVGIKDSLKASQKKHGQVIEEIRNETKIAYSKMGGATMPRLLQTEAASGTNDGANMAYTVKNDPLYMEVGGQIQSIQNGGYTKSGSAPKITITFAFPPPSGQVPNSYYQ